jgi:UDP-glucose 4-epimerase
MSSGITGARGFIGSYLAGHVAAREAELVRLLVRDAAYQGHTRNTEIIYGNLQSRPDCERFASGLNVIYYLAHNNTPVNSDNDFPEDALANLVPLLNLIDAVQRLGTKPHIVYFSTGGAIYAPKEERVPYRENDRCSPLSSYGIQKLAAEEYLRLAAHKGQLTATVLRVGNAYGTLLPHYRMQGLIGVAINNVLHRRPIRVFGDPNNVRDYIHLDDVCDLAIRTSAPRQAFDIVNVSSGIGHSVLEVLQVIEECCGRPIEIQTDDRVGNWLSEWVVLDNAKAREQFYWVPTVTLHAGVQRMQTFWRANPLVAAMTA